MHKFGAIAADESDQPYTFPHIWALEKTTGEDRLAIAPSNDQIDLLQKLVGRMTAPFLLLYVLVVPRSEAAAGRYQSEEPLATEELNSFLDRYRSFLEGDGRHNLWIRSTDSSTLVYDRHNIIYAYGDLDRLVSLLAEEGLAEAPSISMPDPHSHHYHAECDAAAEQILSDRKWIFSPLRKGDTNPGE